MEDKIYRAYITDALYALTNRNQRMAKRYVDIIDPERNTVDETRTPEEIIGGIRAKLERMSAE